jgi:hypothetical protein
MVWDERKAHPAKVKRYTTADIKNDQPCKGASDSSFSFCFIYAQMSV